jgi:hypothetical protein
MKNIRTSILMLALVLLGISCTDDSLDPLQFKKVKKGTLLALRGEQLDAIYWNSEPYGASFFANGVTGNETFDFDAEFLSEDPNSLESFDIYVMKRTWSDMAKKHVEERLLLMNVPFSEFQSTDDYRGPWVSVSIPLLDILTRIGESVATQVGIDTLFSAYADGIELESDLNLTNGEKVLAADLVAAGLYESDQFYPAQRLSYGVRDIDDARPVATTSLRGQYAVVAGKVIRTIIPLMNGAKDTLNITFDQSIDMAPVVTVDPPAAGSAGAVVAVAGTDNTFYIPFTAGGTYTGDVTFTITGATSGEAGALAGLAQQTKTAALGVDNLVPQNISFTTGTRIGKGQSASITLQFNEALGTFPVVTVDPNTTGIDGVINAAMTLSPDGQTATYVYEYKDLDGNATHGDATVSVSGGKDKAGNDVPPITSKPLTIDIGAAPAPGITLDGTQFDWGTQIKWAVTYTTGGSNPGGSTSGTAYYVIVASEEAAPTGFVGGDIPAFIMAPGVSALQTGTVLISSGTSGSVYSSFTPNGTLDVYVIFISSSGVISAISPPMTVTMN